MLSRPFLVSAVVNLALMAVVAFLLIGRGALTARIDELERDARTVADVRKEDAKRMAALEARNGALMTAQAERCGAEGSEAFDRGVRTGVAICQARGGQ